MLYSLENLSELGLSASTSFIIKRPDEKRVSFSIIPYTRRDGNRVYGKILNLKEINDINSMFLSRKLSPINAEKQIIKIKDRLIEHVKSLNKDATLPINIDIAESYLAKKEAQSNNKGKSDSSYRSSMLKAVKLIGSKSLISDTIIDLQKEFDKNFKGTTALHKNLTNRINTLLTYELKRSDRLKGQKKEPRHVRHITIKELERLVKSIEDEDARTLISVAGFTGMRIGEIFGLTKKSVIGEDVIYISRQRYDYPDKKTGEIYGLPKNRKRRKTIIISGGRKYVDRFLDLGVDHFLHLRRDIASILREKCVELWPSNSDKHLEDFHDLRDVFAVHLVSSGTPIDSIAKLMGNSPSVCLENYQGFIASDREIDLVRSILNK